MNHFFHRIHGWFGFQDIYEAAVEKYDGIFVEIGAWKGRSTAFLAVEALNSGKAIQIHVVDTFKGSDEPEHHNDPELPRLREVFDANLAPVLDKLVVHEMTSVEAAELFDDESVSFVFIDAAHDYESVRADILAWLPKLKSGGWMAGDDFYWGGQGEMRPIFRAVSELLPDFAVRGGSWEWVKP